MSTDAAQSPPLRLAIIACAVMETEVEYLMRDMPHIIDYRKLPQGLHNEPARLRDELQKMVEQVEQETDVTAIALVYGVCSRGIEGVHTKRCQMAVVRAHDCLTLLLGSRERYKNYVKENPGTYWYSPGWNRHHTPPGPERYKKLHDQYIENYGEDNAEFLMETEQHWFSTYNRATYVHLTIGDTDEDRAYTQDCSDWLKWNYDEQIGDPALLTALLAGDWEGDDILVLDPGQGICLTADDRVIDATSDITSFAPNTLLNPAPDSPPSSPS